MFGRKRLAALESQLAELKAQLLPRVEAMAQLSPRVDAIAQLSPLVKAMGTALEGHAAWLDAINQGLTDLGTANSARLDSIAQSLETARQDMQAFTLAIEGHAAWLDALDQGLKDLRTAHSAELRDIGRWLASTTQAVTALSTTPVISSPELQALAPKARLVDERISIARMQKIWSLTRWLAQAPFASTTMISVIVPTRNRRPYLERAIASVLAQRHQEIDLVIVDDGSTDDTPAFLATLTDPRLRSFRTSGIGTSAARNLGLDNVIGEIITHLDDDNLLDPGWLHAVAWAFTRWPETTLLYGARIIEDGAAREGAPSGAMPVLEWQEFDRSRLEYANYIDMNVIAHRAHVPEARFDPDLRSSIEWDMLLRLTAKYTPLELPVLACLYSNYAPNRLSDRVTYLQENQLVRARAHTSRQLRVLSYNAMFPLLSETYIEEEMLALEAQGAAIAFAAFQQSISPYLVRQPVYHGLDEAIAAHNPDVIIVYWASHSLGELAHIAQTGRPFAVRVHSFDFVAEDVARLQDHPSCLGVWAFPHHAAVVPGVHELVPIFTSHASMPPPAPLRTTVASVSAGLPKKNWPLLLDAMEQLSDFERAIVLARSNGFEELPAEVTRLASQMPRPPEVLVNLPRADVFALLSKTSALIYTVTPGVPLGMPMSVIEALYAGVCVITPDSAEMRALCGDGYRPYRTATDIVAHVREIMQGGTAIDSERICNHRAAAAFCRPELGQNFHSELSAALTSWRLAQQRG